MALGFSFMWNWNLLPSYVVASDKNTLMSLPSHFSRTEFTVGVVIILILKLNQHCKGNLEATVLVLFQYRSEELFKRTPNVIYWFEEKMVRRLFLNLESTSSEVTGVIFTCATISSHRVRNGALRNFGDVRQKLNQTHMPIFWDQGVSCIAADIIITHPEDFPGIYPKLGIFHFTKVVLICSGRWSGFDGALAETDLGFCRKCIYWKPLYKVTERNAQTVRSN